MISKAHALETLSKWKDSVKNNTQHTALEEVADVMIEMAINKINAMPTIDDAELYKTVYNKVDELAKQHSNHKNTDELKKCEELKKLMQEVLFDKPSKKTASWKSYLSTRFMRGK